MTKLLKTLLLLVAVGFMTGCSSDEEGKNGPNDVIWDISPVNFKIAITDSEGNDLLDPSSPNNLINDIIVQYKEDTYSVILPGQKDNERISGNGVTRAYAAMFNGLFLRQKLEYEKNYGTSNYLLVFGEFDGTENVDKRMITLTIQDNYQVNLSYSNEFHWNADGSPSNKRKFFLDNQELKDGTGGIYQIQYTEGW
jgi:hypothetical protein